MPQDLHIHRIQQKMLPEWAVTTLSSFQARNKKRRAFDVFELSKSQFLVSFEVVEHYATPDLEEYDEFWSQEVWLFDRDKGRKRILNLEWYTESIERVHFSRSGKSIVFRVTYEDPGYPEDRETYLKPILLETIFG